MTQGVGFKCCLPKTAWPPTSFCAPPPLRSRCRLLASLGSPPLGLLDGDEGLLAVGTQGVLMAFSPQVGGGGWMGPPPKINTPSPMMGLTPNDPKSPPNPPFDGSHPPDPPHLWG